MSLKYERFIAQYLEPKVRSGDEFFCICPFHDDHSPSFAINGRSGLWLCHACGVAGNMPQLVDAIGGNLPATTVAAFRERMSALRKYEEPETLTTKPDAWLLQFSHPTDYWTTKRMLSEETIEYFGLGYDPIWDAATIPIRDRENRLLGVTRRRLGKTKGPRYIYPKGFKAARHLFNSWTTIGGHTPARVALVEGTIDAMTCWDAGVFAFSLYGSRLSPIQQRILHEKGVRRVVLFLDNDKAGQKAVEDITEQLNGIQPLYVQYPSGDRVKDPGDLTNEQIIGMFQNAQPHWRVVTQGKLR